MVMLAESSASSCLNSSFSEGLEAFTLRGQYHNVTKVALDRFSDLLDHWFLFFPESLRHRVFQAFIEDCERLPIPRVQSAGSD